MRLYSLALLADNFYSVDYRVVCLFARSEEEAIGKGIKLAQKLYPRSQGYSSYDVLVDQIPDEMIRAAAERSEEDLGIQ